MDDAEIQTRKWTRVDYDRLIEAEFFRPDDRIELIGGHMVVKEPQDSPHAAAIIRVPSGSRLRFDRRHKSSLYARAHIADYWIVNLPADRLEVFREPGPDSDATFGWR